MSFAQYAADPTQPESYEERQRAAYVTASNLSRPIEAFAEWLGTIWDFDPEAVDDHDIDLMQRVQAWIATMPAEMRDAFLAHVKAQRAAWRHRNPDAAQRPMMVLGVMLPGVPER